ncbi:seryl-tRNA synthetase [Brevundimonas phage vB_BpoS-Kabachok]|uniref:Serine--tRNA ligase n=1 Tax=Brevundimonas phage vB_BpoS-Kabachok TaxID=2948600 RepID=A0A9E7SJV7_9CAUD|nr:seryl-tRNA synthetase [Brevundimonas phage vB_BpoS-Kabachok]
MLDFHLIDNEPDAVVAAIAKRGGAVKTIVDDARAAHRDLQATRTELQALQTERNAISTRIGELRQDVRPVAAREGDAPPSEEETLRARMAEIKPRLERLAKQEDSLYKTREGLVDLLPNLPAEDIPEGGEANNIVISEWGKRRAYVEPKDHVTLAGNSYDSAVAGWLSGSRYAVLSGAFASVERALGQFMLDLHVHRHGYVEKSVPFIVKPNVMYATGQWPKFKDDLFQLTDGNLLIPTGEVPLTNLAREQTTEREALPLRFTALTPCFRAEAGAAGRDTTGLIRQHQFMKVELVSLVEPEQAEAEFDRKVACAEAVLQYLELPYRKVLLAAGDMGFAARKTIDLEVWMPSQQRYVEIASISWCGDFQTRRMKGRYRQADGKLGYLHSLNGSGLAVGRTLAALFENHQTDDGGVDMPAILVPYLRPRLPEVGLAG